jgi:iron complex outermembrane recepter protein
MRSVFINRLPISLSVSIMALTGGMIFAGTVATPAFAQDVASNIGRSPEDVATDQGEGLGDIVVTAQKRSENLQRVPIAISALTSETLQQQGIRTITNLANQIPNLQVANIYGDAVPYFSLRGISTSDVSQNQSGPVAVYVDEVYKGLPALSSLQVFDVDRIEVLRGPQGTLYGKNTTGGAVNIYTRQPDLQADRTTGNFSAGYGNYNRKTADAGISVPIIADRLAVRIAGMRTKVDGWTKNPLPGKLDHNAIDDWAFRFTAAAQPADDLKIVLRYTQSKTDPASYVSIAKDIGPGGIGFVTGYTRQGLTYDQTESDFDSRQIVKNKSLSGKMDWSLSDNTNFTSVTSYDRGTFVLGEDVDGSPFNIMHADYSAKARSFSQDVRVSGEISEKFNWLIGGYYYSDRVKANEAYHYYYEFGTGEDGCLADYFTGCGTSHDFQQSRSSVAFYTQENLELSEGLKVTAGLRYTKDITKLDFYKAYLGWYDAQTGIEVVQGIQTISAPPIDRQKTTNWSGKLGISYELPSGTLVYASVNRGYRGGSFNGAAYSDPSEVTSVNPERLDAVEAGIKSQFWDNRIRVNAAAFYYDYRNQQFLDVTPEVFQVLVNAPRSELWGGEVELKARPVEALMLNASVSYLHARFKKVSLRGENLAGNRLQFAPDWTFSAGVTWTAFDNASGKLDLSADTRYASRQYFDAFNTLDQAGYFIHGARAAYTVATVPVTISGWIRNISNKKYSVSRYDFRDYFNFQYHLRGRPREYGVELSYTF